MYIDFVKRTLPLPDPQIKHTLVKFHTLRNSQGCQGSWKKKAQLAEDTSSKNVC